MNKRQITIYASSAVNPSAVMTIAFESKGNNYKYQYYGIRYEVSSKSTEHAEMPANSVIDYLFDNLWYNKPLDEMEKAIRLKYEAYAELLFIYFQINSFNSCLTFDSFSYELIGK